MTEWGKQTLIYSIIIPGAIVLLTSLQNGIDVRTAIIATAISIITALTNLHAKYSSGVKTVPTAVDTTVIEPVTTPTLPTEVPTETAISQPEVPLA